MAQDKLRRLGRSDVEISAIGLGCWQFSEGHGIVGGFWPALASELVQQIVAASLAGGINWFDTAEAYGRGRSEQALARALAANGRANGDVVVATKWWPNLRTVGHLRATIDDRLRCLAPYAIDLHQVHQPFALATVGAQMDAMADLVDARKIRTVGVSNFSARATRAAHAALSRRGHPLVSIQVRYSLLDRKIESNGVMAAAKELGITVIAYSPLEQGLLSGKYHDDPSLARTLTGPRRFMGA
jgi:aryl-alcohol dehydrogenase-like predicted oxidoreductase